MDTMTFLTALSLAHFVGMTLTAMWFFPAYFRSGQELKYIELAQYVGMTLLGWISLICLFIDLNKKND